MWMRRVDEVSYTASFILFLPSYILHIFVYLECGQQREFAERLNMVQSLCLGADVDKENRGREFIGCVCMFRSLSFFFMFLYWSPNQKVPEPHIAHRKVADLLNSVIVIAC